jgi:ubiquinone biosynthesis protein
LELLRQSTQRGVPRLTRPGRIPPIGRLLRVSAELGVALGGWAVTERRVRGRSDDGASRSRAGLSRRLRRAAERLGPTYIKLGQIISSGDGLFPSELVAEFKACRDQVPAEPFSVVRATIEADLAVPLESVFAHVTETPIAAASIAQVHAAELLDGTPVVIKVQRPAIAATVRRDLAVMSWMAPRLIGRIPIAALANPPALVELFAETITEELDFRLEAANMLDVAAVFAELGQRGYVVPRPHPSLVTQRLLVMERFDGWGFDDVEHMRAAGIDTEDVIRVGMRGFTEGAMVHGVFHGDLHGGNLLVLRDGRIGLLDFGITARMTPLERGAFLRLMLCGASGDIPGQIAAFRDLGALPADVDIAEVISELGLDREAIDPTHLNQEQLVGEIQRVTKALLGMGARLPKILMLYVKNLVFLDSAIAAFAPDLDLIAEFSALFMHMSTVHGDRLAGDLGQQRPVAFNPEAVKNAFGVVDDDVDSLTYADLLERRRLISSRLQHGRKGPK